MCIHTIMYVYICRSQAAYEIQTRVRRVWAQWTLHYGTYVYIHKDTCIHRCMHSCICTWRGMWAQWTLHYRMCVHIHEDTCIHRYVHACMHDVACGQSGLCTTVYVYIYTKIHVFMHACMHSYMSRVRMNFALRYVHMHPCICTYTYNKDMCTDTCMQMCMYTC